MALEQGDGFQEAIGVAIAQFQRRIAEADAALKLALTRMETIPTGMATYAQAFRDAGIRLQNDMSLAQAQYSSKLAEDLAAIRRAVNNEPPPYQG